VWEWDDGHGCGHGFLHQYHHNNEDDTSVNPRAQEQLGEKEKEIMMLKQENQLHAWCWLVMTHRFIG
jgi:hypothetical protein